MNEKEIIIIAVIGGGDCSAEDARLAEEVGQEIARRGAALVCGGLSGIMEAACRGAFNEGGLTIGILPGNDRRAANPFVRVPIVTGIGHARNVAVVRTAHAVIAIDGSYGTLSEIGHALQGGIPVIGLRTWSFFKDRKQDDGIITVSSPSEAVERAIDLVCDV